MVSDLLSSQFPSIIGKHYSSTHTLHRIVHTICTAYLDEVAGYVPPCDVETSRQVGQREALVNRTDVSDAVARVDHHAGKQTYNKTWSETREEHVHHPVLVHTFNTEQRSRATGGETRQLRPLVSIQLAGLTQVLRRLTNLERRE